MIVVLSYAAMSKTWIYTACNTQQLMAFLFNATSQVLDLFYFSFCPVHSQHDRRVLVVHHLGYNSSQDDLQVLVVVLYNNQFDQEFYNNKVAVEYTVLWGDLPSQNQQFPVNHSILGLHSRSEQYQSLKM